MNLGLIISQGTLVWNQRKKQSHIWVQGGVPAWHVEGPRFIPSIKKVNKFN